MTENNQDTFTRAYTTLLSLRKNIDRMITNNVPETYVREFHAALTKLEGIVKDVSEFRIPDSAVQPIIGGPVSNVTGESIKHYSKEKYVNKSFILIKLDAILGYFEIITSEKPRRIGFTKSDE